MTRTSIVFTIVLLAFFSLVYSKPIGAVETIPTEISESELSEDIPQSVAAVDETEPSELDHESEITDSEHQVLPLHVTYGCQIRSGSHVVASCHKGELCRYTCRCRAIRKDRFSVICGVRPPLYLGLIHRTKAVVKMRGGAVYSDSGRRCQC